MADNASDTATGPNGDSTDTPTSEEAPQQERPAGGGSPRLRSGMRDMLLSMIVLAVGVLVLAALTRSCSFSPGGPSTSGSSVPSVDVTAELQAAAAQVPFPLRQPQLPDGWRPNSDSVDSLGPNGKDRAVRVGWIAPDNRYLQVSQSNASAVDLVRSAAALGDNATVAPMGSETVDGTKWTVYPGIRDEQSWVSDLGTERLFVTGNGTTADFRTLAAAVQAGRKVSPAGS